MAEEVEIVEGWSAALPFVLYENEAVKDLAGLTVTAEALDRSKNAVTLTGNVSLSSATGWQASLVPDTGDFPAAGSPYELRFKLVDGSGHVAFSPSGEAIIVKVRPWE